MKNLCLAVALIIMTTLGVVGTTPDEVYALASNCADELFISEYIEGSSNNKAIEIYNGTGTVINLAANNYSIFISYNGGSSTSNINLSGSIAPGDVYVLAHSSANAAILAQADQTGTVNYNGNDAVALRKNGVDIDVIGQIGFDPGTEWGGSTADNTMQRKAYILHGDGNGADAFTPTTEWNVFAIDTVSGLGSHSTTCTNKTITLDGTVTEAEWGLGLGTVNSTQFGVTWDDDFWYFSVKGGMGTSDFFMIGIDADAANETSNTGGTINRCGATFPSENKPNYILVNRQNSYLRESWGWNGSAWDQNSFNPIETTDYDFSGITDYEVKLRKSAVFAANEDNQRVGFYLWLSNSSCEFFNAWPPENDNGYIAGSRFLYAHTQFATTDAGRNPNTYATRLAWDAKTLSANSTTYNYFGSDDSANPWLALTTTASGAGGAACSVRAKVVGNRAFTPDTFLGMNRYVDFTLSNCTDLTVSVQMRYEQNEINGRTESNAQFYRCASRPCTGNWVSVMAGAYTRDTINHNLQLADVPQTQFSYWTISDGTTPTAVTTRTLSANAAPSAEAGLIGLGAVVGAAALLIATRRRSRR